MVECFIDIEEAVSSAKDAFASWSGLSFSERANYIMAIADEIDAQSNTFSELLAICFLKIYWSQRH